MSETKENLNLDCVMKRLNEVCCFGEVNKYTDGLWWEYESTEEDAESVPDDLWDCYTQDADIIRKEGFELEGSFADKNKTGVKIIVS